MTDHLQSHLARGHLTRRDALLSLTAAASALVGSTIRARSSPVVDTETARGFVYEEAASGTLRQGIGGIMVSNGRDVALTADNGQWALPVQNGDSIFVIKPAHWSIAGCSNTSTHHQPGCYLHCPAGTPDALPLKTPRIAGTGQLPASIDFKLVRTPEPQRFDVLLAADTQAANAQELNYVRAELSHCVTATKPAFAIHHGDVMGDDLTLFGDHLALTRSTGIPWYHCPGNHDMNLDSPSNTHAFDAWKQTFGVSNMALNYSGATFILLNNIAYDGHGAPRREGRGYRGIIGAEQLQFVANVLKHTPAENLIVVSMHIPLVSFDNPDSVSDTTADREKLLALLSTRQYAVSFAGHSHTTEHHYLGAEYGFTGPGRHHHHVLTAASGAWWSGPADARGVPISDSRDGTPKGVHILSVDGNTYTTRLVTSPCAKDATLRAMIAHIPTAGDERGAPHLVVDVFDGGPLTSVSCRGSAFSNTSVALERTPIEDPHIVASYAVNKALNKPWVAPARSSHIWTIPLPFGIDGDTLDLTINVTTEFGARYDVAVILQAPDDAGDALRI